MTNSYDSYLREMYEAVIADCQVRYPHLRLDFERDLSRLASYIEDRGLSFLMIDLVDFGKHFDLCLSKQRLTHSRKPGFRAFKRGTPIPRLFKGLMLLVFDISGELRTDCDEYAVRSLRQLFYMAKKFRMECSDDRRDKCLQDFLTVEHGLRQGSLNWELDYPDWSYLDNVHLGQDPVDRRDSHPDLFEREGQVSESTPECRAVLATVQQVADIASATLGVFSAEDWRVKHGPGAVSDLSGNDNKYLFPRWPEKLERVFPYAEFAYANLGQWARSVSHEGPPRSFGEEVPSRLIFVPKTLKAPRLIAAEPVAHQWCQQSIKDYFMGRSSSTWIGRMVDFKDQTPNQEMAYQGSLDGSLATIDLSEASDRVSTWLVERIFRRNKTLVDALHACRTRQYEYTDAQLNGEVRDLVKFSCMGSACTFPVQTLIFMCISAGVVLHERNLPVTIGNLRKLKGEVRVFGDDIVVPTAHADRVMEILTHLGLKINANKSFGVGNFRESCGLDVFKGVDVTPTYIMTSPLRSKPESVKSVVESHNNFLSRGWYSVADYLCTTVQSRLGNQIQTVAMDSESFGLKTVGYPDNSHLKVRVNRGLQRLERLVLDVSTSVAKRRDEGEAMLFQYFTERPAPDTNWEAGVTLRPKLTLKLRWVEA